MATNTFTLIQPRKLNKSKCYMYTDRHAHKCTYTHVNTDINVCVYLSKKEF